MHIKQTSVAIIPFYIHLKLFLRPSSSDIVTLLKPWFTSCFIRYNLNMNLKPLSGQNALITFYKPL
mgnify:CR=1 FL=1